MNKLKKSKAENIQLSSFRDSKYGIKVSNRLTSIPFEVYNDEVILRRMRFIFAAMHCGGTKKRAFDR